MSVQKKNRRKISVENVQYVWYIAPDDESPYNILHIVSEDKSVVLAVPLGTEKQYVISKGRLFQKKKTSGTWERYLLPIKMENVITPAFVSSIIRWAVNGNEAVSMNWDGNHIPYKRYAGLELCYNTDKYQVRSFIRRRSGWAETVLKQ